MEWTLATIALAVLGVAAVSGRLSGGPVTATMLFVGVGILAGPRLLDTVDVPSYGAVVRTLAEGTLTLVLFADASRIDIPALRRGYGLPVRLLGIGLPLTIAAGALAAVVVLPDLSLSEALVLAVLLAPTDAALGQAVVTEPRLPIRVRQGLNVESGLNDGICVPLLLIVLAHADVQAHAESSQRAVTVVLEAIGYGLLGGLVAGAAAALVVTVAARRGLVAPSWLQIVPVAAAALAYGIATPLEGSGFIAAFVAGLTFRSLLGRDPGPIAQFNEQLGELLNAVTFLAFGAVLLGPALGDLSWRLALYAVLSLTAVRMVPVALALLGTGRPTTDGGVHRLVRPAGARLDRLRRPHRRGVQARSPEHHAAGDLRDRRSLGLPPRPLRRTARPAVRALVRGASARPTSHGEPARRPSAPPRAAPTAGGSGQPVMPSAGVGLTVRDHPPADHADLRRRRGPRASGPGGPGGSGGGGPRAS